MGGCCCGNDLSIIGEDFILKIIQDPLLKLNKFDYNLLLNSIESKRIQEQIYKNQIKDSLFPIFYEQNSRKSNSKYINSIFSYLLTQFEETNNMNSVLLMFYPFINHKNEIIGETLFNLFQSIYKHLSIYDLVHLLIKYIKIFTQGLTYAVWTVCDISEISYSLDELNTNIYSDNNIKNLVNNMIKKINKKSNYDIKALVHKNLFVEMIQQYDISSVESIRSLLLNGV